MRRGSPSTSDLRLLDEYRKSFGPAHEVVIAEVRQGLVVEVAGRPAKSTVSLVEKLRRETIRLSQIQDVAGCRAIVSGPTEQELLVTRLRQIFPEATVVDRRSSPSHGYRAVHVIPEISNKAVEIQVRTELQHLWAELSEKLSDVLDPAIKYGGGPENIRSMLSVVSKAVEENEGIQQRIAALAERIEALDTEHAAAYAEEKAGLEQMRETMIGRQKRLSDTLRAAVLGLGGSGGKR
jgi:putative GTP pyrophosphokinase